MNRRLLMGGGGNTIDINNYLTIEALEDGLQASFTKTSYDYVGTTGNLYYCIDGSGDWVELESGVNTPAIGKDQTISFKGDLKTVSLDGSDNYKINGIGKFNVTKSYNLKGNSMSMRYLDEASVHDELDVNFASMFYNSHTLQSVSKDFLPAKTLSSLASYNSMFNFCRSLTTAPELPATSALATPANYDYGIVSRQYDRMFSGCIALVSPPSAIRLTELFDGYSEGELAAFSTCAHMFHGCESLTTAPEILASKVGAFSCYYMFYGCSSLIEAPELPATQLGDFCYAGMFFGCGSLTKAPSILPSVAVNDGCYRDMFYNCRSLTKAPELPGFIMYSGYRFYSYMFSLCTKLNYIKCLLDFLISGTNNWVEGVSATGTFIQKAGTTWPVGVSGIPEGWSIYDENGNYLGIAIAPPTKSYTINLNDQWQTSSVANPDSSTYDGVYESFSNYNVNSTAAIMTIDITGYETFKLYIRSYAESNYDYVMVSQLDQSINNDTSYSNTTLVKAHTRGNQQSGTAISNYTLVEFTGIDGGDHTITIVYRKDSSSKSGTDKGYILIPKNQ